MFSNANQYLENQINKALSNFRESLIENIPCKVKSINKDNLTLNLESLIDKRIFSNVPFLALPNMQFNLENLQFGLFLAIDYFFYSIQSEGTINTPIKATQSNYGLFIPILGNNSTFSQNKENEFTIFDKDNNLKFIINQEGIFIENEQQSQKIGIDNQIQILGGNQPLKIENNIGSIKDLISSLIECINLASLGTGNQGSPIVQNPQLAPKITELQTKLNQILG